MKIVTWNVNSVRAREERVLNWLSTHQPELLCLQETKVVDDAFPHEALAEIGYRAEVFGQKTYNGVALIAREEISGVERGLPGAEGAGDGGGDDAQARFIAGELRGIRVANCYVPMGTAVGHQKYEYKLRWYERLLAWLQTQDPAAPVIVLGDFNVALDDRDVYDPDGWRDGVLFSDPERAAVQRLLDWGLKDGVRLHSEDAGLYTWWDYRQLAFPKNRGLRIDHLLLSAPVAEKCTGWDRNRDERKGKGASDHIPIWVELDW